RTFAVLARWRPVAGRSGTISAAGVFTARCRIRPSRGCTLARRSTGSISSSPMCATGSDLAVFLLTSPHWDAESIGVVMTIMGLATLAAQTPAGAFIDATRWKRAAIVAAAAAVGLAAIAVTLTQAFLIVAVSKALMGIAVAVFGPAVNAITRG